MVDVDKLSNRYIWQGLGISFVLMSIAYVAATSVGTMQDGDMSSAVALQYASVNVLIGFCFYMFVTVVEALVWRRVASNSLDGLPTFFMGVSGVRLLSALAVMFVYYLVACREAMLPFFLTFAVFYVAQLIHHSYFFSRVSRMADDSLNR